MSSNKLKLALAYVATRMTRGEDPELNERFAFCIGKHLFFYRGMAFDRHALPGESLSVYRDKVEDEYNRNVIEARRSSGEIEAPMEPHIYYVRFHSLESTSESFKLSWDWFSKCCATLRKPDDNTAADMRTELWAELQTGSTSAEVQILAPSRYDSSGQITEWKVTENDLPEGVTKMDIDGFADIPPAEGGDEVDYEAIAANESKDWRAQLYNEGFDVWEGTKVAEVVEPPRLPPASDGYVATLGGRAAKPAKISKAVANGLKPAPMPEPKPEPEPESESQSEQQPGFLGDEKAMDELTDKLDDEFWATQKRHAEALEQKWYQSRLARWASEAIGGVVLWAGYVAVGFAAAAISGAGVALVSSVWFPVTAAFAVVAGKLIAKAVRKPAPAKA